ncbi:hypothetical protein GCM10007891_24730 [Methylophaga thalassica]|uniref:Uncharacterized protein n=1 Tax=Methylophaga thalassica TaxID=40223 RepID=A0ABQ5TX94_9GAMM|nr:hypothetical protein [Methylophaga thalassica]GLQ00620.1 hypothetical protein GCM10007891_24730 [Methylophaga thalassica]
MLSSLDLAAKTMLFCAVTMIFAFALSFLAEPFQQEIGFAQSILGYNRDFFVTGRWYFIAIAILQLIISWFALLLLRQKEATAKLQKRYQAKAQQN